MAIEKDREIIRLWNHLRYLEEKGRPTTSALKKIERAFAEKERAVGLRPDPDARASAITDREKQSSSQRSRRRACLQAEPQPHLGDQVLANACINRILPAGSSCWSFIFCGLGAPSWRSNILGTFWFRNTRADFGIIAAQG